MIYGIGCDIVSIKRVRHVFDHPERSWHAIFTPSERAYFDRFEDPWGIVAGHFAAKEACAKALGTGFRPPVEFLGLEILHDQLGKPQVRLAPRIEQRWPGVELMLSISHEKEYAVAYALAHLTHQGEVK